MKCFVCGSQTPGEVCSDCVRTERSLFHREWTYKEGFLVRKVENYRLDVTTYRVSGTGMLANNDKGTNGRVDAFNHFIGNIDIVEKRPYNGKDALMIHYKNPFTQLERYIFFLGCDAVDGIINAIENARKDIGPVGASAFGGGMNYSFSAMPSTSPTVGAPKSAAEAVAAAAAAAAAHSAASAQQYGAGGSTASQYGAGGSTPSQYGAAGSTASQYGASGSTASQYTTPSSYGATPAEQYVTPAPTVSEPIQSAPESEPVISPDNQLRLGKLKVLLDTGILSQAEYDQERARLGV